MAKFACFISRKTKQNPMIIYGYKLLEICYGYKSTKSHIY